MPFLLACKVSAEKPANNFIRFSLYVTSCFYLVALKIVSLYFDILSIMYLGVDLFGFNLFGTTSWSWKSVSFSKLWKFLATISSSKFYVTFSFSFPSRIPIMWMLVCLILSQRSQTILIFKKFSFLFSVLIGWFPLPCLLDCWFILLYYLMYYW